MGRARRQILLATHTRKWYLIDQHSVLYVSSNLAAANLGIQVLGVAKCPTSNPNPVFVAHPLCPPHLRRLLEETVQAVDNSWLRGKGFQVWQGSLGSLARLCPP
jgi:hypothetical protein